MPLYDYQCEKCQHKFEIVQSIKSESKAKCPKCNSNSKRLISKNVNIIFKGQDWACKSSGKYDDDMVKSVHPEVHKAHKDGKI